MEKVWLFAFKKSTDILNSNDQTIVHTQALDSFRLLFPNLIKTNSKWGYWTLEWFYWH